jgi:hypothetical protein
MCCISILLNASVTCLFAAIVFAFLYRWTHRQGTKKIISGSTTKITRRPPRSKHYKITKCPFSSESNFIFESAEHLPPSPLDLYDHWIEHLACRWLAAGIYRQETPGRLRANLKRLRSEKHFLVQDSHKIREELALKKKHLDDPRGLKFVMEPESLDAQHETLELFMGYLPDRYPDMYTYNLKEHSITVHPIHTTFLLNDWKHAPLELCARIVQEDLILMRRGDANSFHLSAAAVVFSFSGLKEKLGKPAEFIHAPVPGYAKDLSKTLNLLFSKVEQPLWRNNWGLAPTNQLDKPEYGEGVLFPSVTSSLNEHDVKSKFLKVEYQTIRRLPRTQFLLFTVKTMVDPLSSLEHVDRNAAACLAQSIRGLSAGMRRYKGIDNEHVAEAFLTYLDSISNETRHTPCS